MPTTFVYNRRSRSELSLACDLPSDHSHKQRGITTLISCLFSFEDKPAPNKFHFIPRSYNNLPRMEAH
jgi:hypothetical protein